MFKKENLKSNKGITMITLIITLVIILILGTTTIVNVAGYSETKRRTSFESDLTKLSEAVSLYYNEEKEIPKVNSYSDLETIQSVKNVNDNDKYFVIDLRKLNVEDLEFGKDFDKVIEKNVTVEITDEDNLRDVYIINEQSLTIYYPKGVEYHGITHYRLTDNDALTEGQGLVYINNADQLYEFRDRVNSGEDFSNTKVMLMTDIDLIGEAEDNSTWWTPIGKDVENKMFNGTFDGNNHTISNIFISGDSSNSLDLGFFGCTSNATIKNITITGTVRAIESPGHEQRHNCAALVGKSKDDLTLQNCISEVNVTNQSVQGDTAGLVAVITSSDSTAEYNITIKNCKNKGAIVSNQNASGIVAKIENKKFLINVLDCANEANVTGELLTSGIDSIVDSIGNINLEKCTNSGTITSNTSSSSGIVTRFNNNTSNKTIEIKKCENNGIISASTYAGGIIATVDSDCDSPLEITDCKNNKTVTANTNAAGGCIAYTDNGSGINISNFSNTDVVKSNQSYAGGCVGLYNNNAVKLIINNGTSNIANVNGYLATGGIVGHSNNGTKVIIYDSYNTASIMSRNKQAGGIIGLSASNTIIVNTYNSGRINAQEVGGGIVGLLPDAGGTIKLLNSYNRGQVTATGAACGIIGKIEQNHTFENCIIKNVYNAGTIDTATNKYSIIFLENKLELPESAQILADYFKSTMTKATNLTTDIGTKKTDAQLKAQAFTTLLKDFVTSNTTFNTGEDLNISLKQWKYMSSGYPVFE